MYIWDGKVTFDNCTIYKNTAEEVRARLAPYIHRPDGSPSLHLPCPSCQGGGVYIRGGTVTFTNCKIYVNIGTHVRARLAPYIHRPDGSPSLPVFVGRRRAHQRRHGDLHQLRHLREHRHLRARSPCPLYPSPRWITFPARLHREEA